jgi:hypothetical protein
MNYQQLLTIGALLLMFLLFAIVIIAAAVRGGAGASMAAGEADRRADAVGVEERSAVKVPSHEEAVHQHAARPDDDGRGGAGPHRTAATAAREREMNELIRRTSTSTWLPWREVVDRVARHLGYPTENARLRIVRKAKARPVRAHGRTAEGWSVGWSVSPVSVAGYAIDLDSGALGPPHFSGEVINDVKLCIDDMIAADLLPAPGRPEGPVERAWWPAVEAAAYIIKGAPIEWEDWGPGMHREAARRRGDQGGPAGEGPKKTRRPGGADTRQ